MKRYLIRIIVSLLLLVEIGSTLLFPVNTYAATGDTPISTSNNQVTATWTWVNADEIDATINGTSVEFTNPFGIQDYFLSDPSAGGNNPSTTLYQYSSTTTTCQGNYSAIGANPYYSQNGKPNIAYVLSTNTANSTGGGCNTVSSNSAHINDVAKADIFFQFDSSGNIDRVDGDSGYTFIPAGIANVFVKSDQTSSDCPDTIVYNSSSSDNGTLYGEDQGGGGTKVPADAHSNAADNCTINHDTSDIIGDCPSSLSTAFSVFDTSGGCASNVVFQSNGSKLLNIGGTPPSAPGVSGSNPAGSQSGTGSNAETPQQSACLSSSFALGWLVCPIVDVIQTGVNTAVNLINSQLTIPVSAYFATNCGNTAANTPVNGCGTSDTNYKLWGYMRDIGLSLLVIVALIMVISTAIDIGPFDAYAVKKTLPRIFVAVILITFSWQFGRFLVQFSDDLGSGIYQLIYSTVGGPDAALNGFKSGFLIWLGVGGAVGAGAALITTLTVGPLAVLMLLIPAILAFAIGFFVIIVRRLIIVLCVITAPVALISFILPGTQKFWKVWTQTFSGALFLFPMITAALAAGGVMAYLTDNGNAGNGFIAPLASFIFYFAPFFLLPKLAKMSTGALGMVAGLAGNLNKAGSARFAKSRQNFWAARKERSKTGDLWTGKNPVSKAFSNRAIGLGTGGRGHFGFGEKGKKAIQTATAVGTAQRERDLRSVTLMYDDAGRFIVAKSKGKGQTGEDAYVAWKTKELNEKFVDDHKIGKDGQFATADDKSEYEEQLQKINETAHTGRLKADLMGYSPSAQVFAAQQEFTSNKGRNIKTAEQMVDLQRTVAASAGVDLDDFAGDIGFRAGPTRSDLRYVNAASLDEKLRGVTDPEQRATITTNELSSQVQKGIDNFTTYQLGQEPDGVIETGTNAIVKLAQNAQPDSEQRIFVWNAELDSIAASGTDAAATKALNMKAKVQDEIANLVTRQVHEANDATNPAVVNEDSDEFKTLFTAKLQELTAKYHNAVVQRQGYRQDPNTASTGSPTGATPVPPAEK